MCVHNATSVKIYEIVGKLLSILADCNYYRRLDGCLFIPERTETDLNPGKFVVIVINNMVLFTQFSVGLFYFWFHCDNCPGFNNFVCFREIRENSRPE